MSTTDSKRRLPSVLLVGCAITAVCLIVIVATIAAFFIVRGRGGKAAEPTIEYILDTSPRMESLSNGDTRIRVARGIMAEIVRTADPRLTAGLRVFGTGAQPQGCQDTDLVVPFATANQGKIEGQLGGLESDPNSDSPVAQAMIAAIKDMASTEGPHSMVVVTGGADSCNPEAAELIRQEAEKAKIELRVFVVGFEVPQDELEAVKALVELIPGATYVDAPEAASLRDVLFRIQVEVDQMVTEAVEAEPSERTAATACDHPYMPLRTGATWSYAGNEGSQTWSITSANGSANTATATMDIAAPSVDMTSHWTCDPSGINSYDFGNLSVLDFGDVAKMDVIDSSGTWLPSAENLTPGYSWNNDYTTVISVSAGGISLDITTTSSETWTVSGVEMVVVPAGTFDALRIDGTTTTTISGMMVSTPAFSASQSYWFAEGVGIVRYTTQTEGYSDNSELTAYSVP